MLREKIYRALKKVFSFRHQQQFSKENFPDEILKIISEYADFPQVSKLQLDEVNEARYFLGKFSAKYVRYNFAGGMLEWVKEGKPLPIFSTLFPNLDLSNPYVCSQLDDEIFEEYMDECQQVLEESVFPYLDESDYENLELQLFEEITLVDNCNPFQSNTRNDFEFSGIKVWTKIKTVAISVDTPATVATNNGGKSDKSILNWGRLLNIISHSQASNERHPALNLVSFDFDYHHSKFIVSIKLR